jgi:hypothetical protein
LDEIIGESVELALIQAISRRQGRFARSFADQPQGK